MISWDQVRSFYSDKLSKDEFKQMISEVISETHPGRQVKGFRVNLDKIVEVVLDDGEIVEIEVDWDEVILK